MRVKKIPLFLFLFLLSVTLFGQSAFAAGPNLIQNPSLENASGTTPNQWSKVYWGNIIPDFSYPVAGHTSNGAQITLPSNTTGDARWSHNPVTVEPGAVYEFSSWYKSNTATEVDIKYISANGTISWGWVASLPSSGNVWKQVTANITIPANVTKVVVFNLIDKQGSLTVDDYSLAKKDTTTPPTNGFTEGMVTFSFDDAWTSQYTNALPIIQDAGIKGTYYILTQPVTNGWSQYMTPAQVKDISTKGQEIGGHTVTHTDLTTLSNIQIDKEIIDSKTYLQNLTGKTVNTLAYPYGSFNTTVKNRTTNAGYTNARSAGTAIQNGFNSATQNKFEIKSFSPTTAVSLNNIKTAIDQAKTNKQWFVFSFHRIENGTTGEYITSVDDFKAIVDYVKNSGIKTVTMQEGASLLK